MENDIAGILVLMTHERILRISVVGMIILHCVHSSSVLFGCWCSIAWWKFRGRNIQCGRTSGGWRVGGNHVPQSLVESRQLLRAVVPFLMLFLFPSDHEVVISITIIVVVVRNLFGRAIAWLTPTRLLGSIGSSRTTTTILRSLRFGWSFG